MSAAIVIGGVCILAGQNAFGKGVILGALFSVINFVLMGETLPQRIGKSKGGAIFAALGSMFFRYLVLAVPLVIAIKLSQIGLFGVIFGLFAVQISILGENLVDFFHSTRH